jgi:hypothetical protein
VLRLTSRRRIGGLSGDRAAARALSDTPALALDPFGTWTRVLPSHAQVVAGGVAEPELPLELALAPDEQIADLALAANGILHLTLRRPDGSGRILLVDRRDRFEPAAIARAGFSADRVAVAADGRIWALDRGAGRVALVKGEPLPRLAERAFAPDTFRPSEENLDPLRLELLPEVALALGREILACTADERGLVVLLFLAGAIDPDPVDGDEAAFLSVAVATLESAVAILRVVEGRIEALRTLVEQCETTLGTLGEIVDGWQSELATVDRDLAERRHDVRVADALIAEERARIAAVNARRKELRDRHVRFVAYARPCTVSLHSRASMPAHPLAGVLADPVPACLLHDVEPPEALVEMLAVLRDVPLAWLPALRPLIARLDRPALLDKVYGQVKLRAQLKLATAGPEARPNDGGDAGAPRALAAVTRLLGAYREVGRKFQRARPNLDLASQARLSWEERRRRAEQELSLNDLIESGGRPDLVRRASQELEQIERVASCLLQRSGEVLAATRLAWSQALSVFDAAQDLSRLDRLPGWRQLDFALARELASLVVWLFGRVDPQVGEARTLISDLVRICLLLPATRRLTRSSPAISSRTPAARSAI